MVSRNSQHSIMGRHNTSIILYVVLAGLVIISVYFYWSLSSQVKGYKVEKKELQDELSTKEDDLSKLRNSIKTFTEELNQLKESKNTLESEKQKLDNELTEAKSSLVSITTKLSEAKANSDSLQQQLSAKTDEVDKLTQESITKQSLFDNCQTERDECKKNEDSASQSHEKQLTVLQSRLKDEASRYSSLLQEKNTLAAQYSQQGDKLQAIENQLHSCQSKGNTGDEQSTKGTVATASSTVATTEVTISPDVSETVKKPKEDENDDGQGGQPILGVEEEKQSPGGQGLLLGDQQTSDARQSEKMGGVGTESDEIPKSRGEDAAPDYHSDFEQQDDKKSEDNKDTLGIEKDVTEKPKDTEGKSDVKDDVDTAKNSENGLVSDDSKKLQEALEESNKEDFEHIDKLVSQQKKKKHDFVQYATEDNKKDVLKRSADREQFERNFEDKPGGNMEEEKRREFFDQIHNSHLENGNNERDFYELMKNKINDQQQHHRMIDRPLNRPFARNKHPEFHGNVDRRIPKYQLDNERQLELPFRNDRPMFEDRKQKRPYHRQL